MTTRSTILSLTVSATALASDPLTYIQPPACALRPDLALFSDGDMTQVGEKGITVSDEYKAA